MIKHCFLPLVTTLLLSSILVARDHTIGQARGYPPSHVSSFSHAVGQHITVQGTGHVEANAQGGFAVASAHAHDRGRRHHRPRPTPHMRIGHLHGGTHLGLHPHGHLRWRSTPHMRIGHLHGGVHLGLHFHTHLHSSMGLSIVSHLNVGGHSRHFHHNQH